MAAGYAPGASSVKFLKLSGEEIPCTVPAMCTVGEAISKLQKSKSLPGGSLRIIAENGKVLNRNDVIPEEGVFQVQVMSIAQGQWLTLYSGAFAGFDEASLRQSVARAWPGDFERQGPELDDGAEDIEFDRWQQSCFEALQPVVVKSVGPWADYWTFGSSADSYGYQYVRHPYATMAPSIDLIVNDLKRWQQILLELEDEFAHLRSRCGGFELCEHLEYAIGSLLRYCPSFEADVSWHVGFEMWYEPFAQLVGWYLSSAGFEESKSDILSHVDNAIQGFDSYHCPVDTAAQVAEQVASKIQETHQSVDSTAHWLTARSQLQTISVEMPAELPGAADLHLRFIEAVDYSRNLLRGERMQHALAQCRDDARFATCSATCLEWDHLLTWHQLTMGNKRHRGFRSHDAYAKQGRERYPLHKTSEEKFKSLLEEANSSEPIALRATRAYLDVLFFHPFEDGNSRLARLVFDFLLTRAGYTLSNVEMIFLFAKAAKDGEGAANLVQLVNKLLAKPFEDFNVPLLKWVAENPHPGLEEPGCEKHVKWFNCNRFPEDAPPSNDVWCVSVRCWSSMSFKSACRRHAAGLCWEMLIGAGCITC